ncbi:prepilin-type N-terminal cleavage/methylation domain-containing protein [candidate division KSB3 bacterium]|uniref:Prepilin-type N-terminal cleavage/methylation domain-containing protein n=1 Tax=candidate division KSB3 bacterium TaxID=2044937 RepID=A0A9D5JVX5_9BACT|nr:prepilin-type N-terminal cleavage/methylation domain-containing protein [candidate division KSB3 bacterium]MBD3325269.1 prepilin-type N-terminal cleavage/methylation domain-containing protein [candidate division KSB3 bacterium]
MKTPGNWLRNHQGMTLLEVMVTLGVLSGVLAATLTMYSNTYKNIRTREALIDAIHDIDLIMTTIGDDIRQAQEFLPSYHDDELGGTTVAAMKIFMPDARSGEEAIVVYSLDTDQADRLVRSLRRQDHVTSVELSSRIQTLQVIPKTDRLIQVDVTVEGFVDAKRSTVQASSVYAMRK